MPGFTTELCDKHRSDGLSVLVRRLFALLPATFVVVSQNLSFTTGS
jgi:hypothetical protein